MPISIEPGPDARISILVAPAGPGCLSGQTPLPNFEGGAMERDHAAALMAQARGAVVQLAQVEAELATDRGLTDAGRIERAGPARETAERVLGGLLDEATRFRDQTTNHLQHVLAPPPIEATDAAGAIRDMEVRQRLLSASAAERADLLAQVVEHAELQDAVRRSPIKMTHFAEAAERAASDRIALTPEGTSAQAFADAAATAHAAIASLFARVSRQQAPAIVRSKD